MQNIEKDIVNKKKTLLNLAEREVELLTLICQGLSNKELSEKLYVSIKTIESNKSRLMKKTNTRNTVSLIIWAIKNKIIEL
jgi:DNA-binding NarL/FixJ family response regulator